MHSLRRDTTRTLQIRGAQGRKGAEKDVYFPKPHPSARRRTATPAPTAPSSPGRRSPGGAAQARRVLTGRRRRAADSPSRCTRRRDGAKRPRAPGGAGWQFSGHTGNAAARNPGADSGPGAALRASRNRLTSSLLPRGSQDNRRGGAWTAACYGAPGACGGARARRRLRPGTRSGAARRPPRALGPAREKYAQPLQRKGTPGMRGCPREPALTPRPPKKAPLQLRTVANAGEDGTGPSEPARLSWTPRKMSNLSAGKAQARPAPRDPPAGQRAEGELPCRPDVKADIIHPSSGAKLSVCVRSRTKRNSSSFPTPSAPSHFLISARGAIFSSESAWLEKYPTNHSHTSFPQESSCSMTCSFGGTVGAFSVSLRRPAFPSSIGIATPCRADRICFSKSREKAEITSPMRLKPDCFSFHSKPFWVFHRGLNRHHPPSIVVNYLLSVLNTSYTQIMSILPL